VFEVLQGDVREQLNNIEAGSIQTCVTSPPYWGLRSYLEDGHKDKEYELGAERTPEEYVANMVEVFRGVKRALRDDGIMFLNLGDTYSAQRWSDTPSTTGISKDCSDIVAVKESGLANKNLVGIPWKVAFALQADGWILRSAIPWLKGSAMPESVTDRPSSAIEYFFLLAKNQKYYYDVEAIRTNASEASLKRINQKSFEQQKGGDKDYAHGVNSSRSARKTLENFAKNPGRNRRNSDWFMDSIQDILDGQSGTLLHDDNDTPIAVFCNPKPYKGAHFATFSPHLITPMILAGTSPKACEVCGSPWERVVEKEGQKPGRDRNHGGRTDGRSRPAQWENGQNPTTTTTAGWQPSCTCNNNGTGRCKVLDPFAGSGTTLWVAEQNGRDSVGIELNAEYIELIDQRMDNMQMNLFMLGGGCD
jgi:DNA modification methylase